TEQITATVPEVNAAVSAADEDLDPEELSPRVSGSAVDFRTAAYEMIEQAEEWAEELRVPGEELLRPLTSVSAEFPRVAIALVEDGQEAGVAPAPRQRLRGGRPRRGLRAARDGRGVGRAAPWARRGAPGAPDLGERRVPAGRERAGRGLPGGGGALLRGAPAGGREVPLHH